MRALSGSFPKLLPGRAALLNAGKLVICLSYSINKDDDQESYDQWHHIGEIYWNPIRPTCHLLRFVAGPDHLGEYHLQADTYDTDTEPAHIYRGPQKNTKLS